MAGLNYADVDGSTGWVKGIELLCVDMAGTIVADGGIVLSCFEEAIISEGLERGSDGYMSAVKIAHETMGTSKIVVLRRIFGDENSAQRARQSFEANYELAVSQGRVTLIAGTLELLASARDSGIRVAAITGFSLDTQRNLVSHLGLSEYLDLTLAPSREIRSRPFPDLIWHAGLSCGVTSASSIAVLGDTPTDIETALASGCLASFGVMTGGFSEVELRERGPLAVLRSISELTIRA